MFVSSQELIICNDSTMLGKIEYQMQLNELHLQHAWVTLHLWAPCQWPLFWRVLNFLRGLAEIPS